jgi:hypothetical protein
MDEVGTELRMTLGGELSMLKRLATGFGERAATLGLESEVPGTVSRGADGVARVTGSLERFVGNFVEQSPRRDSGFFDPPTDRERVTLLDAWSQIKRGQVAEAADLVKPMGMRVVRFVDTSTEAASRHVMLFEAPASGRSVPRGLGLYVHRNDAARGAVHVQAPHPWDDIATDVVSTRTYLTAEGRSLAVSGASRWSLPDSNDDDAAHSVVSLFHSISESNSRKGARLVQLHGFNQAKNPAYYGESVVSTGDLPSSQARAMQRALIDGGIDAKLYVATHDYINLGARNNVQGIYARQHGASFVHVELGDSVRMAPERRGEAIDALVDGIRRAAPKPAKPPKP